MKMPPSCDNAAITATQADLFSSDLAGNRFLFFCFLFFCFLAVITSWFWSKTKSKLIGLHNVTLRLIINALCWISPWWMSYSSVAEPPRFVIPCLM